MPTMSTDATEGVSRGGVVKDLGKDRLIVVEGPVSWSDQSKTFDAVVEVDIYRKNYLRGVYTINQKIDKGRSCV